MNSKIGSNLLTPLSRDYYFHVTKKKDQYIIIINIAETMSPPIKLMKTIARTFAGNKRIDSPKRFIHDNCCSLEGRVSNI